MAFFVGFVLRLAQVAGYTWVMYSLTPVQEWKAAMAFIFCVLYINTSSDK